MGAPRARYGCAVNRKFVSQPTPARARLLVEMANLTPLALDQSILDLAEQDRLTPADFERVKISDPLDQRAVQFILDMNFRCGIPAIHDERQRALRIVEAARALAGIEEFVMLEKFSGPLWFRATTVIDEALYEAMYPHRQKLLIIDLDSADENQELDLVAKMFPRIVAVGTMARQYTWNLGSPNSTTSRMGDFLYPSVAETFNNTTWLRNSARGMMAVGAFPHLIESKERVEEQRKRYFS